MEYGGMDHCGALGRERAALRAAEASEPLLQAPRRWTLFPLQATDLYDLYKQSLKCFWTVEEIDFAGDRTEFEKLPAAEQRLLEGVLAFFAASDALVMHNVSTNFLNRVVLPEAQLWYAAQNFFEGVHSEAYSLFIEEYVSNAERRAQLFDGINTLPAVRAKAHWAQQAMGEDLGFAERLLAYALVEGVFFSASFAIIFWYRSRGKLPGLSMANDFIARDEGLHVQFAGALSRHLNRRPSTALAHDVARSAIAVEDVYVDALLPEALTGLSAANLKQHARAAADVVLELFGLDKCFGVTSPLDFVKLQNIPVRSNFFEKRPTEYARFAPTGFAIDERF
jgi:ribonucleotide reductase beta subunit family protein with ferritin-like domain